MVTECAPAWAWGLRAMVYAVAALATAGGLGGCQDPAGDAVGTEQRPIVHDASAPRPVEPRDGLERMVYERRGDLALVDRMVDPKTAVPEFEREPLPPMSDAAIAPGVAALDDRDPFRERPPLRSKEVTIRVGLARSTYRTRTPQEVLSAVQPFIDIVQREVNIRGDVVLYETAEELYFAMLEGTCQMAVCHVFDYLTVRSWFKSTEEAAVILAWARPANARSNALDGPGIPGTGIEMVVARDTDYEQFGDLRGARLALATDFRHAPGAFVSRQLANIGQPPDQPFFGRVTQRRYPKDAVLDVIKGRADVACVDQGTLSALDDFYGLDHRIRTLAVSPRYNVDVLFTSTNNVATNRTEIELTETQLTTLRKDPEGQEVLFFFDVESYYNHRDGDLDVPRAHFEDYLRFLERTPVDLRPLLDPNAKVERWTYDRFGDE